MNTGGLVLWMLTQEARGLLTRLDRVQPFALRMPTVPAAAVSPAAQTAIENHVARGKGRLRTLILRYQKWLAGAGRYATPADAQRRMVFLRMRFNAVISQNHIFADVLTQRCEYETGVWVAGLDDVAADALTLPGKFYDLPPVICYVDRGQGGAIRRARTRLPGGDPSPVAIIRVPHERMIGSGIASSLVHEVGHQASELLDLVNSIRPLLKGMQTGGGRLAQAWRLWERWISEILADFWGVARAGVASTLGLIELVSLPRAFVFRIDTEDPHPTPWIRVKLSCGMGRVLFPHPQWDALAELWESMYPPNELDVATLDLLKTLERSIPSLVALLVNHRPKALLGQSLMEALHVHERQPGRLLAYCESWARAAGDMQQAPPSLVFAALGQAKASGKLTPEAESNTLAKLLTYWAMRSALHASATCAMQSGLGAPGSLTRLRMN